MEMSQKTRLLCFLSHFAFHLALAGLAGWSERAVAILIVNYRLLDGPVTIQLWAWSWLIKWLLFIPLPPNEQLVSFFFDEFFLSTVNVTFASDFKDTFRPSYLVPVHKLWLRLGQECVWLELAGGFGAFYFPIRLSAILAGRLLYWLLHWPPPFWIGGSILMYKVLA